MFTFKTEADKAGCRSEKDKIVVDKLEERRFDLEGVLLDLCKDRAGWLPHRDHELPLDDIDHDELAGLLEDTQIKHSRVLGLGDLCPGRIATLQRGQIVRVHIALAV